MDGRISVHFREEEFACGCGCGRKDVSMVLVLALECVRERFGRPVRVNSGRRCVKRNRAVGGEADSRHLTGEAADIVVDGVPAARVAKYAGELLAGWGGVGAYGGFTHIDVRREKARWRG